MERQTQEESHSFFLIPFVFRMLTKEGKVFLSFRIMGKREQGKVGKKVKGRQGK